MTCLGVGEHGRAIKYSRQASMDFICLKGCLSAVILKRNGDSLNRHWVEEKLAVPRLLARI